MKQKYEAKNALVNVWLHLSCSSFADKELSGGTHEKSKNRTSVP
jgi:hypothetical protein